jgi:DnaJ like chaperone protein
LGAVLGTALGHGFDRGVEGSAAESWAEGDQERVQTAFFTATFSVLGHMAKVDGQVSPEEIRLAESVMREMDLDLVLRRAAVRLFTDGKAADFPLDQVLAQFRRECHRRQTLLQMFLEIQLQAAYADGNLEPAEERLLLHICAQLGVPELEFRRLERLVQIHWGYGQGESRTDREAPTAPPARPPLEEAYALLGLSPQAGDGEVKQAYRRLMNQHHPDKLVAKGLPEEMMKLATRKTQEIRRAYERIKEERGLR